MSEEKELKNNNLGRGSEWRRWDLHVHTKDTNKNDKFVSSDFESYCIELFTRALENKISVIGITDYFSIENFKKVVDFVSMIDSNQCFDIYQKEEIKKILILPNVELRMIPVADKNRLVNIHCIFNNNPEFIVSLENIFFNSIKYSSPPEKYSMNKQGLIDLGKSLGVTTSDEEAYKKGVDNFVISHGDLQKIIDENPSFRDNVIIAVSNSNCDGASSFQQHYDFFEDKDPGSLESLRKSIYCISSCIFSGNPKDKDYFLGRGKDTSSVVVKKCGSIKPCIHGSDAHTENKLFIPDQNRFCWIKSDPTFEGLKQVIYEPEERVRIQSIKPDEISPAYRIDRIEYLHNDKKQILPLNSYLNSIIGIRASGKSTLLKNIVKNVDIKEFESRTSSSERSLLDISQFEVVWSDGVKNDGEKTKTCTYIPQNFLSELVHNDEERKEKLIKFVKELFERNNEFKNQKDKLELFNREIDKKIYIFLVELFNNIKKQDDNLDSLRKKGSKKDISENIKRITESVEKVRAESELKKEEVDAYTKLKSERSNIEVKLKLYEQDISSLRILLEIELVDFNILNEYSFSEITKEKISDQLKNAEGELKKGFIRTEISEVDKIIDKLKIRSQEISKEIEEVEVKVKKESLLNKLSDDLNKEKLKLEGVQTILTEQKILEKQLKEVEDDIIKLYLNRIEKTNNFVDNLENFNKDFNFIKINLQRRFNKEELIGLKREINYHESKEFKSNYKNDSSYVNAFGFLNDDETKGEDKIIEELFKSVLYGNLKLKVGIDKLDFLVKLFQNWHEIDYQDAIVDKDENTPLLKMSDGQKMNALLELLFSFDDYSFPILIDQPEDDLDIKAVANMVVDFVKNKKKTRQIILVSHNANLVVGADSENIIIAEKDFDKKIEFYYDNGAIENPEIKSEIVEILEGGEIAFMKRGKKLGIIKK